MSIYIGLDIGGTKFMVAAADETCELIRETREETPADLQEGIDMLNRMIAEVRRDEDIIAIGAAIGGPLDWKTGVVSPLHQPQWRNLPLKQIMEQEWQRPFFVDVDTNVAALAEYRFGALKAEKLFYMTVSTGIGGGYVMNGDLYRGMAGAHPEVGHQCITYRCSFPDRITCECGASNCLEGLVSGNGIRRVYGKAAEKLDEKYWHEVTYNLAQGLRNIATIYLPDVIVLGGGVSVGGGDKLIGDVQRILGEELRIVPVPKVVLSELGYHTALLGGVALAMQQMQES
jgi:predicted NBD/HSP70 family sugar kinase